MAYLIHYGMPRRSGRYPWGSGENPYQHEGGFRGYVRDLRKQGYSEKEIADGLEMTTTELRKRITVQKEEEMAAHISEAVKLKNKGYSNVAIAEKMGVNESNVRSWLMKSELEKAATVKSTADILKSNLKDGVYLDVGVGVEKHMGISRDKLKKAIAELKEEGYEVHYLQELQVGTGKKTSMMVLAEPGTSYSDVSKNRDRIEFPGQYSEDGGLSYIPFERPRSISSKRIQVVYGDKGGEEKDGVIELRRGVEELSLGDARYAQVRIAVDDTHYLKGMAIYADDLPPGVDIRFNTNKKSGTPLTSPDKDASQVLKPMKSDPENPFGATIKLDDELILAQRHYTDKNGKRQLSAINIVNEEGDWSRWSKSISSQMLSKQSPDLAKKQLDKAYSKKQAEYDEIMSLTMPAVKQQLLNSFADDCDAAASHLKAAAFPRQATRVILPFNDIKENEIYAPSFRDGEKVVLIRYPHAGTFEIPELTVNNRRSTLAKKAIGTDALDAVGINYKVAQRLSGADFDGDNVLVIPNNDRKIRTSPPLKGLSDFDPKASYPYVEGMKVMTKKRKGQLMGDVSNLITDMTIQGAPPEKIARAVKHSMVVIDAEKHKLNYEQSYKDQGIAALKAEYQGGANRGASTLISKASSDLRVPHRKEGVLVTNPETGRERRVYVDPKTGKKLYTETGEVYYKRTKNADGTWTVATKPTAKTTKTTKMANAEDAFELSSGTRIEAVYARHANSLKALANKARLSALNVEMTPYSPSAKKTYVKEVSSLRAKLKVAQMNAPLERKAQSLANIMIKAAKESNPDMDRDDIKKLSGQKLKLARARVGAHKTRIDITEREWQAIQAGALSQSSVKEILRNSDLDYVKRMATPKKTPTISTSQAARARSMLSRGYTQAEVADAIGVSVTTLMNNI